MKIRFGGPRREWPRAFVCLVVLSLTAAATAAGKVFLTQEEALRLAFPQADVQRKTAFLSAAQQEEARRLSGAGRAPGALVTYYVASRDGRELGRAYFDSHVVRTQAETLMIAVDGEGAVSRIEVLSFSEPEEYLPRTRWYGEFKGRRLDDELTVKRGIPAVSGATLTARATTDATRRVLAIDRVLRGGAGAR